MAFVCTISLLCAVTAAQVYDKVKSTVAFVCHCTLLALILVKYDLFIISLYFSPHISFGLPYISITF